MICFSCGLNNADDDRFCAACGTPLGAAAVSADSVPPPAAPASLPYPAPSIPTIAPPDAQYPYAPPYGAYPYPPQPPQKKKMPRGMIPLIILVGILIVGVVVFAVSGLLGGASPGAAVGNTANFGLASEIDGWIYFTNLNDNNYLYKMRADGSDKTLVLEEDSRCISIADGWIYYYNYDADTINKVKPGGSQQTEIISDVWVRNLVASNGWLYFDEYYEEALYKIKIDGTELTKLSNGEADCLNLIGNWLYYIENNVNLCKINIDGSQYSRLCSDEVLSIAADGDWIYYVNADDYYSIYRIKTDGSGRALLIEDADAYYINVSGNWIYYTSDSTNGSIWRAHLNGSGTAQLNHRNSQFINIVGDLILYLDADNELYSMALDGKNDYRV